ncbi:MAG: hypothetical protein ABI076_03770 [Acidobacteriaceae bacterium]
MAIQEQKSAVLAEAQTWMGTPFRDGAMVKGQHGGVDCSYLLKACYCGHGAPDTVDLPLYNLQFMLNRIDETYIEELLKYYREIRAEETMAADVCLLRWGHIYSHGMILLEPWPGRVIHALNPFGVIESNGAIDSRIVATVRKYRDSPPRFFRILGW